MEKKYPRKLKYFPLNVLENAIFSYNKNMRVSCYELQVNRQESNQGEKSTSH